MMRIDSFVLVQVLLFVILVGLGVWLFQMIWESDLPMWAKWMLLK